MTKSQKLVKLSFTAAGGNAIGEDRSNSLFEERKTDRGDARFTTQDSRLTNRFMMPEAEPGDMVFESCFDNRIDKKLIE